MSEKVGEAEVRNALKEILDPETGRKFVDMDQLHAIETDNNRILVKMGLTSHSAPLWSETQAAVEDRLRVAFPTTDTISVEVENHSRPPERIGEIGLTVKSVIAVGSGKGGVGKSTIAASIAVGLNRAGCQVGLVDADVYGPSIPHLFGVSGRPEVVNQRIEPIQKNGLRIMSMGFLVPPDEAVIWRGPMLHGAITQFLRDTNWGELDYLIIDMPPGTGDIALTLSQLIPLTGAVVVCTPQDVALLDAVKAIAMFRKVNIPVLGMVENMSGFVCPDCHKRHDIFGSGGARKRAEELDVPFLGEVPINVAIRTEGDEGRVDGLFEDSTIAESFEQITYRLVRNMADSHAESPPMPTLPVL